MKREIISALKVTGKVAAVFWAMGLTAPTRQLRNYVLNNTGFKG